MNSRTKSTVLKLTLCALLCAGASLTGITGCDKHGIIVDFDTDLAQAILVPYLCSPPTSSSGGGASAFKPLLLPFTTSTPPPGYCTGYGGSISASANNGPECLDINSCYNNPAVPPGTPSKPCPAITFYQAPHENAVGFDTTGTTVLTSIFYRQPDGNFTAQGFSVPAAANDPTQLRINAVGTPLGTIPQAQRYFTNCRGLPPWTPKPHPTVLADQPGTMSRDLIVTNLFTSSGGSSAYAEISANSSAGTISVSLDSLGTLGKTTTSYQVGQKPAGLLTADFNGDGQRDVAVINTGGTPGSVSILLGNGAGTLSPRGPFNVGNGPSAMTSFDFNQDGRADLAVVNQGDNSVTVLIANADGTMKPGVVYPLPGQSPTQTAIVAADFDGDGKADLMVYCSVGFVLLHGNGDGTFQVLSQKTGYAVNFVSLFLTPGDFNKDSKMDLASFNNDGTVAILLNAGDGSFPNSKRYVAGTPFSAGSVSPGMFAMDFNDDGNPDLVFATGHPDALYANPAFVTLMLGNGDGTFLGPAPAWQVGNNATSGNNATAMAMADFNGDGRNDLVVTSNPIVGAPLPWLLFGAQGGGFQTPTPLAGPVAGDHLVWVTTADLNGDGRLDIIALSGRDRGAGLQFALGKVYMWLSNGDGTFQTATSLSVDGLPTFVAAGDVNGDGRADLILTYGYTGYGLTSQDNPLTTSAMLFTSKPGGGFNSPVSVPLGGPNAVQVVLADVNGDGRLDLIAANHGIDAVAAALLESDGNVSVSLGSSNGTFQTPVPYFPGSVGPTNPTWVAVAPINGDSKPDLMVGLLTPNTSEVQYLAGKGDGTFTYGTETSTFAWPSSVITADFDGDGKQDLAIVHISGDAPVTVMRGNGDGTFQPETLVMAGSAPQVAIAADFTGGGRPDLAVLNFTASNSGTPPSFGTVHLFRNAEGILPSATHFTISAPTTSIGIPFNFTVTAVDTGGAIVTTYSGTVHFTSSDSLAALPADATLTNGTGQFTATLKTTGSQTITATDAVNSSVTGTSGTIVFAFPATHFKFFTPATATAGTGFNASLQAVDINNNVVSQYSGTVHFTSTDPAASLPPDSPISSGLLSFAATLKTGGNQTITATDTAAPSLTGTSATIMVTLPPLHFSIDVASSIGAGSLTGAALITGAGPGGGPDVRAFDSQSVAQQQDFFAYAASFAGGVSVASGLLNGAPVIVTGAGPGGAPQVKVFDGATLALKQSFLAFDAAFTGGVSVAFGTVNGNAVIVAGAGPGGGPQVSVFDANTAALKQNFFAFSPTFTGGVSVAFGTMSGNPVIAVGAGAGGGPQVNIFDAATFAMKESFFAFSQTFTGGVSVAMGQFNGHDAVVAGAGPGGGPEVKVLDAGTQAVLADFFAFDSGFAGGVHVAAGADGIVVGTGSGGAPEVKVFSGTSLSLTHDFLAYSASFTGGVFVADEPAPESAVVGASFNVVVSARTASNAIFPAYTGTVHFASTDPAAVLPANATISGGTGTFSVTLNSTGAQTITATDTVTPTITGTSSGLTVLAAPHFRFVTPPTALAGVPFSVTLAAVDGNNNTLIGYAGTVHFTSTDTKAALPLNSKLTNGTGMFSVTLSNPGSWTITATDTVTSSMAGTSSSISVTAPAVGAVGFLVSAPASAVSGTAFNLTVTAVDANNNAVPGYAGTLQFSSTDVLAGLPLNSKLTNGTGTFSATLNTTGSQKISAVDTVNGSIKGTSSAINVTAQGAPPPVPVSVTPSSGNGLFGTYTLVFSDPRGYQDLDVVNLLVNNFIDGRHACYLAYSVPSSALFLVDDGGDAGGPFVQPGVANTLQNSQCGVNLQQVVGSGNTLTLVLLINWTTAFAGDKILNMAARDISQNNSGWHPLGVLRVPGTQAGPIGVVSAGPGRGSGMGPTAFTFTFSDTKGFADLGVENVLVNGALDGRHACYMAYARSINWLYLEDDTGSILGAGQSFATAGSLSNSQCTVSWGSGGVSTSGNNLTLTLNVAFTAAFDGDVIVYAAARDGGDQNSTDWHAMATWTVK